MLKGLELNQFVQFEFDIKGVRQIDDCKRSFLLFCLLIVCSFFGDGEELYN